MINLLSIVWDVDPTIFSIGKFDLNFYPLFFLVGIFPLGYYLACNMYKKEGLKTELVDSLMWAVLIGIVVGARLGHVLFYDPKYYLANPLEILMTWKGGLASHGGTVGVIIAVFWYIRKYGKKYNIDALWLMDRVAIPTCFVACFIRLGNLFNSEIYGNPTDLPWGFIFTLQGETVAKHPTQIYEALCYLVLGLMLLFAYYKLMPKLKRGMLVSFLFIWIFGWRFMIEYIKEPQSDFEIGMFFNMGQILSIPFILAGIILMIWSWKQGKPALREIPSNERQSANINTPKQKGEKRKGEKKFRY